MYTYSKAGVQRLETCHKDLQTLAMEIIKWRDAVVFCGHRGEKEQTEAFMSNKSKVKWPNSYHNKTPSMALDLGPYFKELSNTDWNDRVAFAVFAGQVLQIAAQLLNQGKMTHAVTWGGDWDSDGRNLDQNFHDLPHFQLEEIPESAIG